MLERIEGTVRLVGLACQPPEQEAVVEGGSDDAQRISRNAVQGIESTGCQQLNRGRPGVCRIARQRAATPRWSVHFDRAVREPVDVCQRGQRVHQRVAWEERGLPQDRQVRKRPPARNEVPVGVRVASPFPARGEVEERAGLRCRLAEMTGSAGCGSAVFEDATEFRDDPGRSRRVVEQQFPEVPLGLGCLEERIRTAIGKPWLRKIRVVRWHHQLLDATDLVIDESAQFCWAGTLPGDNAAPQQGNGQRRRHDASRAERTPGGSVLMLFVVLHVVCLQT